MVVRKRWPAPDQANATLFPSSRLGSRPSLQSWPISNPHYFSVLAFGQLLAAGKLVSGSPRFWLWRPQAVLLQCPGRPREEPHLQCRAGQWAGRVGEVISKSNFHGSPENWGECVMGYTLFSLSDLGNIWPLGDGVEIKVYSRRVHRERWTFFIWVTMSKQSSTMSRAFTDKRSCLSKRLTSSSYVHSYLLWERGQITFCCGTHPLL